MEPEPPNEIPAPHERVPYAGQEDVRATRNPYVADNVRGRNNLPRAEMRPGSNAGQGRRDMPRTNSNPPAGRNTAWDPPQPTNAYLPPSGRMQREDSFQKYDEVEQVPNYSYSSYSMTILQDAPPPPRPKTPPQLHLTYNINRIQTPPAENQVEPIYYQPPPNSTRNIRRTLSSLFSLGVSIGILIYLLIHFKVIHT